MTEQPNFRVTITTRYTIAERTTYEEVLKLAERTGVPKSRVQLLLVKQGLKYLNGPIA